MVSCFSLIVGSSFLNFAAAQVCSGGTDLNPYGEWQECPSNISVYEGCEYTVHALFKSINKSYSCIGEDSAYGFTIEINQDNTQKPAHRESVNSSEYFCNVSKSFVVHNVDHIVTFIASNYQISSTVSICCNDILEVYGTLSPPRNTKVTILCNLVVIEWDPPEILNGYRIYRYLLRINNSSHFTDVPRITLSLIDDGLTIGETYQADIAAEFCGGLGDASIVYFVVASKPYLLDEVTYTLSYHNESYDILQLLAKVADIGCLLSYPTALVTYLECNGSGKSISCVTSSNTVNGIVGANLTVPSISDDCDGYLVYKNNHPENFSLHIIINDNDCSDVMIPVTRTASITRLISVEKTCSISSQIFMTEHGISFSSFTMSLLPLNTSQSSEASSTVTLGKSFPHNNANYKTGFFVLIGCIIFALCLIIALAVFSSIYYVKKQRKRKYSCKTKMVYTKSMHGSEEILTVEYYTKENEQHEAPSSTQQPGQHTEKGLPESASKLTTSRTQESNNKQTYLDITQEREKKTIIMTEESNKEQESKNQPPEGIDYIAVEVAQATSDNVCYDTPLAEQNMHDSDHDDNKPVVAELTSGNDRSSAFLIVPSDDA